MAALTDAVQWARHHVHLARPVPAPDVAFAPWAEDADAVGAVPVPDAVAIPFDVLAPKQVVAVPAAALTAEVQAHLRDEGYYLQGGPAWLLFTVAGVHPATGQRAERAFPVYVGDLQPEMLRLLAEGGFGIAADPLRYTIWSRNVPAEDDAPPAGDAGEERADAAG